MPQIEIHKKMIFVVVLMLWFFNEPQQTLGITVSPDLGIRNSTLYRDYLLYNNSDNMNLSLMDRNRRLVPYMTFYVPDDLPVSQYYTMDIPEQTHDNHQQYQPQQKQVIAIFASHPHHQQQHQIRIQQQQQQQQQQLQPSTPQHIQNLRPSSYVQQKFPIVRPQQQYQAITYGTRHLIPNKSFSNNYHLHHHQQQYHDHLPMPVSYKQSNIYKPLQNKPVNSISPVRLNPSPFRPENKVPGPFIPIVYPDPEIHQPEKQRINPIKSEQNDEYSSAYYLQQKVVEDDRKLQPIYVQQTAEASTTKPLYPLLNEVNLDPAQHQIEKRPQQPVNRVPSYEEHRLLTPEEKYVIYLEEQLVHKQRQHQQKNQKHQKFSSQAHNSPLSNSPQVIVVSSTVAPLPDNQILHQEKSEPEHYKQLTSVYHHQNRYNQAEQYPQHDNQQNFIEYVEPEQNQQIVEIPANVHVTTTSPIVVSSVGPIYADTAGQKPFKSVASAKPPTIQMQHFYKQEKRPIYIMKSTITPKQTVRQHLTETTQVPPPTLTTYHPIYATSKPTYTSYHSSEKPLKLKPSHRYKPIVVTQSVVPPSPMSTDGTEHSIPPSNDLHTENKPLPDFKSGSLADILRKLQESNHLPQTLTPDNIDNSIRTLIKILNNLKQSQVVVENPPQHHDEDYEYEDEPSHLLSEPGPNSGRPGIDYPALAEIPQTSFNCKEQRYKGFFGDPETNCQVWHYCDLNGGQASFLCPNGTIFSQVALTCDWWFNVKCSSTAQLYVLNERLYKYILPFTPKFPEDYSGPLVDKYLALKFKEMEEKMKKEKMKGKLQNSEESKEVEDNSNNNDGGASNNNADDEDKSTNKSSSKNTIKSVSSENDDDDDDAIGENHGTIDTGIPISSTTTTSTTSTTENTDLPITSLKPIIVTSTGSPYSSIENNVISSSTAITPNVQMRTSVESEKVEVIEIKTDGNTGHLIPPQQNYSKRK